LASALAGGGFSFGVGAWHFGGRAGTPGALFFTKPQVFVNGDYRVLDNIPYCDIIIAIWNI
jgi:hypothetical protein